MRRRPQPPRSYLYVPGDAPEKLAKAFDRGAGAVIIDLEDAIAPSRKTQAREMVRAWVATISPSSPTLAELWVRVNSGPTGVDDLDAVFSPVLSGICVPKVHGPGDLAPLSSHLRELEKRTFPSRPRLLLQPLIETASAVLAAAEIARVSGVSIMQLGELDLAAELGVTPSPDDRELLPARSQLVLASSAARINPPVGPVSADFSDVERLRASTLVLKRLGYRSRACIHPAQVTVVNDVFTPTNGDVERAQRLVDEFDKAVALGSGVLRDENGAMVDEAVVRSGAAGARGAGLIQPTPAGTAICLLPAWSGACTLVVANSSRMEEGSFAARS